MDKMSEGGQDARQVLEKVEAELNRASVVDARRFPGRDYHERNGAAAP
jgi:hypothetical protein